MTLDALAATAGDLLAFLGISLKAWAFISLTLFCLGLIGFGFCLGAATSQAEEERKRRRRMAEDSPPSLDEWLAEDELEDWPVRPTGRAA